MNRWLLHERYRSLAIAPDRVRRPLRPRARGDDDRSRRIPGRSSWSASCSASCCRCFSSRRVNIGLDETWELPARAARRVLRVGPTLRALPELDDHEMIIWGDMFSGDPELVAAGARRVSPCASGATTRRPVRRAHRHARRGRHSLLGGARYLELVEHRRARHQRGRQLPRSRWRPRSRTAGHGFLNTDWGDHGHLQQLPISDPGFAYGAAVSWCLEANADIDLAARAQRARVRRPDRRARAAPS